MLDFSQVEELSLNGQSLKQLKIGNDIVWEKSEPGYEGTTVTFTLNKPTTLYFCANTHGKLFDYGDGRTSELRGEVLSRNYAAGTYTIKYPAGTTMVTSYNRDTSSWRFYYLFHQPFSYQYYETYSDNYYRRYTQSPCTEITIGGSVIPHFMCYGYAPYFEGRGYFIDYGNLRVINIESTVGSIGTQILQGQKSLQTINIYATSPPTLSSNFGSEISADFQIRVPYSADHSILNAYKSANNWSRYADNIFEESN